MWMRLGHIDQPPLPLARQIGRIKGFRFGAKMPQGSKTIWLNKVPTHRTISKMRKSSNDLTPKPAGQFIRYRFFQWWSFDASCFSRYPDWFTKEYRSNGICVLCMLQLAELSRIALEQHRMHSLVWTISIHIDTYRWSFVNIITTFRFHWL